MAIQEVTDQDFKTKVLDEKEKVVLVDFWAEWCGPCRMLAPIVEKASETFKEQLNVFKLDTDKNMNTAQTYQITSIPCCILFKNGEEIHRIIGHKPQPAFEAEIQNHL